MDKVRRAMEDYRQQRGAHVRKLREARGWSIETLAQKAGMSAKTVGRIERGKTEDPRATTFSRLARALGVAEAEIRGEPPVTPEQATQLDRIEAKLDELLRRLPDNYPPG